MLLPTRPWYLLGKFAGQSRAELAQYEQQTMHDSRNWEKEIRLHVTIASKLESGALLRIHTGIQK